MSSARCSQSMDRYTEIAEIFTVEGYQYFRFDPEHYEELEKAIALNVAPNSVVFVATYPIH